MLFSDLHKLTEISGLVLVQDTIQTSSQALLNHLYSRFIISEINNTTPNKYHRNIWFINFNQPLYEYQKLFNQYSKSNFIIIDCYSNVLRWNIVKDNTTNTTSNTGPISIQCDGKPKSIISSLFDVYSDQRIPPKLKESPLLMINSISTLVLKDGLAETCNLLRTLININLKQQSLETTDNTKKPTTTSTSSTRNRIETGIAGSIQNTKMKLQQERTFSSVFAILHTDLHYTDPTIQKQLEYLSTTAIHVTPLPPNIQLSQTLQNPYVATITVIHKKRSGRVVRNVEYYYQKNGRLEFDSAESLEKKVEKKELDPTELDISFNLKLSEQEKAARDAVVLPYRHQGENQLIIEDPDEEDFDDEDPDDDLDI